MNRRQFLAISSATVAAGPLRTLLGAQAAQPAPQPRFENIRRNVGYFTARGGTIGWLSSKDALVTVDTQYLDTAKVCVDGLRERAGGRGIDVAFNTHHHGDHTSGNPIFKAAAKRLVAQVRVPNCRSSSRHRPRQDRMRRHRSSPTQPSTNHGQRRSATSASKRRITVPAIPAAMRSSGSTRRRSFTWATCSFTSCTRASTVPPGRPSRTG